MCLVALMASAQPVDDLEVAAVGEKVENDEQPEAAVSDDLEGAEHRYWGGHRRHGWGGGYGGYGKILIFL